MKFSGCASITGFARALLYMISCIYSFASSVCHVCIFATLLYSWLCTILCFPWTANHGLLLLLLLAIHSQRAIVCVCVCMVGWFFHRTREHTRLYVCILYMAMPFGHICILYDAQLLGHFTEIYLSLCSTQHRERIKQVTSQTLTKHITYQILYHICTHTHTRFLLVYKSTNFYGIRRRALCGACGGWDGWWKRII